MYGYNNLTRSCYPSFILSYSCALLGFAERSGTSAVPCSAQALPSQRILACGAAAPSCSHSPHPLDRCQTVYVSCVSGFGNRRKNDVLLICMQQPDVNPTAFHSLTEDCVVQEFEKNVFQTHWQPFLRSLVFVLIYGCLLPRTLGEARNVVY